MAEEALISIIVPVYNVENYIEQCLDSLINQTYKNLEIVIVNDGSTDSSGEFCEQYAEADKRIKYHYQKNNGVALARNVGLDIADGEYVCFVDPDDYCEFGMLEKLYELIVKYDADVACCRWKKIKKEIFSGVGGYEFAKKENVLTNLEMVEMYTKSMDWPVWNKLYKKELIKSIKFPEIRYGEDFFTVFRWLYNASKIVYIQDSLYNYRIMRKGSNTSNRNNILLKISCDLNQLQQFKKMLFEINDSKLIENFNVRYLRSLYDLRCDIENTEESEEKRSLLSKIDVEIKNLDIYINSLGRSKCFKLLLLEKFKTGYKLLLLWENVFKDMERKIRKLK